MVNIEILALGMVFSVQYLHSAVIPRWKEREQRNIPTSVVLKARSPVESLTFSDSVGLRVVCLSFTTATVRETTFRPYL